MSLTDSPRNASNHDSRQASLANSDRFEQGQIIGGKYRVISLLGQGGMGTVYRVQDLFQHLEFALKTLDIHSVSQVSVRRFQIETKAASLLDHPNLVRMHDFGLNKSNQPYLVMEFVEGVTMCQYLKQHGCMTMEQAIPLFARVCCGLHYAHEKGVVHRDIKPSNIMLVKNAVLGSEGSVKVVDFGIARLANGVSGEFQSLTTTGEIFGSPLYMSPEQCSGEKVDHRSDIYSLGCVLFEALTGAPPHLGQSALATMMMHKSQPAPSLKEASLGKEFSEVLEQIVSRMLCKSPDDRYQNLGTVAHQLAAVCGGGAIAEILLLERKPPKTPRVVSLSPSRLCSLLAVTAIGAASLSVLSLRAIEQRDKSARSSSHEKILSDRATFRDSKTLASDIGLLDGLTEFTRSRLPSPDSINRVLSAEASASKRIIFPTRPVGRLFALDDKGVRKELIGEAKGSVDIPADLPITLEMNESVLLAPAILRELNPGAIDGLVFNCSNELRIDKCKSERYRDAMKDIFSLVTPWKNLRSVALLQCPMDNKILASLNRLKNVQYLELNNIVELDKNALSRQSLLRHLKGLYIVGDCVDETIWKISGSYNLESLFLTNTRVSPEAIQQLARCPRLEFMSIVESREKKLDDRIIDTVVKMRSLRTVAFDRMNTEQVSRLSLCPWIKTIWLYGRTFSSTEKKLIKSLDARVEFAQ